MPKYIIHIGPPKTGSKAIQSQLFHNRPYLEAHGVLYPDNWWTRPDKIFHDAVLDLLREDPAALKPEFEKINQRGFEKVILSCEGFDGLDETRIERFRAAIGDVPVEILYYARRWSDRIPSDWRQRIMMEQVITFPEFYLRYLGRPEATGEINYSIVWDGFAKVFGRENLSIVSYSHLVDKSIDPFEHFCRAVVGLPEVPQTKPGLIQHNRSPSMIDAEILRGLNYLYHAETGRFDVAMRVKFLRLKDKYDLGKLYEHLRTDMKEIGSSLFQVGELARTSPAMR